MSRVFFKLFFRNTNDDFEGAIEFFQDPVNACQFLINNVDCRETCNFCDLCKTPGADQLICESTSQLCNNQFWQNPLQCTNICENGQSQCKKGGGKIKTSQFHNCSNPS